MKNKNFIKAIIIGLCVAISAVLYMVTIPKETEEMARLESEKEELSVSIEDTKSEISDLERSYDDRCKQVYEIIGEEEGYYTVVEDEDGNMFWFGK